MTEDKIYGGCFNDGKRETLKERVARVKAYLEYTREEWKARVAEARKFWPEGFEESVLVGPVED